MTDIWGRVMREAGKQAAESMKPTLVQPTIGGPDLPNEPAPSQNSHNTPFKENLLSPLAAPLFEPSQDDSSAALEQRTLKVMAAASSVPRPEVRFWSPSPPTQGGALDPSKSAALSQNVQRETPGTMITGEAWPSYAQPFRSPSALPRGDSSWPLWCHVDRFEQIPYGGSPSHAPVPHEAVVPNLLPSVTALREVPYIPMPSPPPRPQMPIEIPNYDPREAKRLYDAYMRSANVKQF